MNSRFAAVVGACALTIAACSSSSGGGTAPRPQHIEVSSIRDAVVALEAKLGGDQRFFEINATPTLVNLFVADGDAKNVTSYLYVGSELEVSDPSQPASGATFSADEMTFDANHVLDQVRKDLPRSSIRVFSVVGLSTGGAGYVVTIESDLGGILEIPIRADGTVIPAGG